MTLQSQRMELACYRRFHGRRLRPPVRASRVRSASGRHWPLAQTMATSFRIEHLDSCRYCDAGRMGRMECTRRRQ